MAGDVSFAKSTSPLDSEEDEDYFMEDEEEETRSSFFMFLLTLGGLGLQIGWSVETSNGSVSVPVVAQAPALSAVSCVRLPS